MLEEGEIDEEDALSLSDHSSNSPSKKQQNNGEGGDDTKSTTSSSNKNRRSESSSRNNKTHHRTTKRRKQQHHRHQMDSLDNNDDDNFDDNDFNFGGKDADMRIMPNNNNNDGDLDERIIPNGNNNDGVPQSLFDLFLNSKDQQSSIINLIKASEGGGSNSNDLSSILAQHQKQQLLQTSQPTSTTFIDPIITEKENNRPNFAASRHNHHHQQQQQRHDSSNDQSTSAIPSLFSIDSSAIGNGGIGGVSDSKKRIGFESKKNEKRRKYFEQQKNKQQNNENTPSTNSLISQQNNNNHQANTSGSFQTTETPNSNNNNNNNNKPPNSKLKTVLCRYFVEGRCQKGDDCTFSHDIAPLKKYECCKYYLNGFCSKGDKCIYLHSEFPCKFFHRRRNPDDCKHGPLCRFSHEPITNPLIAEAFENHLVSPPDNTNQQSNQNDHQQLATTSSSSSIPSLMNMNLAPALQKPSPSIQYNPNSPPPSISLNLPPPSLIKQLSPQPGQPSPSSSSSSKSHQPFYGVFQDIDERGAETVASLPLSASLITKNMPMEAGDIDERAIPQNDNNKPVANLTDANVNEQLVVKIMKCLSDEDTAVFKIIPKHVLTDLLVKLLNKNDISTDLDSETCRSLLITLNATMTPSNVTANNKNDQKQPQKETLNAKKLVTGSDYDDTDNDSDDSDDENDLVIEGNPSDTDIPYKLFEIEVDESKLWSRPPTSNNDIVSENSDQECDPRIKYYSNRENSSIISKFQAELIKQQEKESIEKSTPASPSTTTTTTTITATTDNKPSPLKEVKKDPRLMMSRVASASSIINGSSPTRSNSPANTTNDILINKAQNDSKNKISTDSAVLLGPILSSLITNNNNSKLDENQSSDLISIQNKQLASGNNSLLFSLPDVHFPVNINNLSQMNNTNNTNSNNSHHNNQNTNSAIKLSIADYKRKVKTVDSNGRSNNESDISANSSIQSGLSSSSSSTTTTTTTTTAAPSFPSIPSYSVNLQAPQSLHEMLRNFQS
jgi:hypothetical protein